MNALISLAKLIGGPGSLRLLAIAVVFGLIWSYVWPRRPRSGWLGLVAVLLVHTVMALPIVATALMDQLPVVGAPSEADIRNIQTLFILDGDNRFGRIREFERIFPLANPRQIFLLGRLSVYKDLLLMPIPRERLHHDESSHNTASQVERVAQLVAAGASDHPALLVSRIQFPRVVAFAAASGLRALVVPAPLDDPLPTAGGRRWLPSLAALAVSRDTLYELVALQYYHH